MRFGTDELGTYEIGTYGLVYLRLVKPSCAGVEVPPFSAVLWFQGDAAYGRGEHSCYSTVRPDGVIVYEAV